MSSIDMSLHVVVDQHWRAFGHALYAGDHAATRDSYDQLAAYARRIARWDTRARLAWAITRLCDDPRQAVAIVPVEKLLDDIDAAFDGSEAGGLRLDDARGLVLAIASVVGTGLPWTQIDRALRRLQRLAGVFPELREQVRQVAADLGRPIPDACSGGHGTPRLPSEIDAAAGPPAAMSSGVVLPSDDDGLGFRARSRPGGVARARGRCRIWRGVSWR